MRLIEWRNAGGSGGDDSRKTRQCTSSQIPCTRPLRLHVAKPSRRPSSRSEVGEFSRAQRPDEASIRAARWRGGHRQLSGRYDRAAGSMARRPVEVDERTAGVVVGAGEHRPCDEDARLGDLRRDALVRARRRWPPRAASSAATKSPPARRSNARASRPVPHEGQFRIPQCPIPSASLVRPGHHGRTEGTQGVLDRGARPAARHTPAASPRRPGPSGAADPGGWSRSRRLPRSFHDAGHDARRWREWSGWGSHPWARAGRGVGDHSPGARAPVHRGRRRRGPDPSMRQPPTTWELPMKVSGRSVLQVPLQVDDLRAGATQQVANDALPALPLPGRGLHSRWSTVAAGSRPEAVRRRPGSWAMSISPRRRKCFIQAMCCNPRAPPGRWPRPVAMNTRGSGLAGLRTHAVPCGVQVMIPPPGPVKLSTLGASVGSIPRTTARLRPMPCPPSG